MRRRQFIHSAAALPVAYNHLPFGTTGGLFSRLAANADERVLVLIQLTGGNDGLNTLVPLDQYDRLANVRGNVLPPRGQLMGIGGNRALHPRLGGLRELYDEARVTFVQDLGYPNPNRSHFRSTDIYQTASPSDEVYRTGWLGRHFDRDYPGFPNGYPSESAPDPVAVTLGNSVSETCQGIAGNFALTVNNPFNLTDILTGSGEGESPGSRHTEEREFLRQTIAQANAYGVPVQAAAERGDSLVDYPDTYFATQLSHVARMISGGLRTKVYVVSLGGFDTHAAQVESGAPSTGRHAELLQTLSDGIAAFQRDISALGYGDRVLGMTYSEFGRRIMSNAANGTDHGTAAPGLLFGECVSAGVVGDNPVIPDEVDIAEGVPMQYDFRDVYGTVLEDWFGLGDGEVRDLLYAGYTRLPLLTPCGTVSSTDTRQRADGALALAPSPFGARVQLTFDVAEAGRVSLTAFDVTGALIEVLFERRLPAGPQTLNVDTGAYPTGPVFFRVQQGTTSQIARGVRL